MQRDSAHTAGTIVRFGVVVVLGVACLLGAAVPAFAATFDPVRVISNDNMRANDSMSVKDIQAFLETLPGPMKTLVTADYDKVITVSKTKNNVNTTPDKGETPKPASQIIWEACQAWKISPKVMLTMLQKEQSLLTRTSLGSTTLARAVGAGCPGSLVYPSTNPVATNRYPGFGNQVWHGARLLSSYGEGNPNFPTFSAGMSIKIYKIDGMTHIHPSNLATFKLYVYNPSIGANKPYGDLSTQSCAGNANFWKIYRKYFGDTYANPRLRRIYRLKNRHNGTYIYTTSAAERYHKTYAHRTTWGYDGSVSSADTSVATTATVPMYRFYNKSTHRYSYVTSHATYEARRSATGRLTWSYQGVAFRVARNATTGAKTVWRFVNRKTGGRFLTQSSKTRAKYLGSTYYRRIWKYEGVAFYLPRAAS